MGPKTYYIIHTHTHIIQLIYNKMQAKIKMNLSVCLFSGKKTGREKVVYRGTDHWAMWTRIHTSREYLMIYVIG